MQDPTRNAEIVAALLLMVLGGAVVAIASQYALGTVSRMGPGFVPVVLGALLMVVGLINAVAAARMPSGAGEGSGESRLTPKTLGGYAIALAGMVAFAFLAPISGLVPATALLVVVASFAERPVNLKMVFGLAVLVPLLGYLVFIRGLSVPLRPFWW